MHAHCQAVHGLATYAINKLCKHYHVVGQQQTLKQYIPKSQFLASFPAGRVTPTRGAFEHCRVDYMGALKVKQG